MGVGKQKGAKVHGNLKDSCSFVVHENRLVRKLLQTPSLAKIKGLSPLGLMAFKDLEHAIPKH